MHCHGKTAQLVRERGGEWLFPLKANRPALHNEVVRFFAEPPEPLPEHTTVDAGHGRLETRRHRVWHEVD